MATIVTGGGRGIGRSITLRMAREGPVIAVGRTLADLESVCLEVVEHDGKAEVCLGDVTDPSTAARALEIASTRGWELTNLVCNAGIGKGGPTENFSPDLWKQIFDVNVHGSFHFVQACLPGMIARSRGAICLMSSVAGVHGVAYDAAYSASKHALVGLARSLALEHGKHGIVAVPICPGFVAGEMTDRTIRGIMVRGGLSEAEATKKVAAVNPQRRIISAEEVAEAVALICSGQIPSLTGEPLLLNGGA
jgi:NAD(P)-dependent dehydrogenase (short-subunit alcohol dehydrogenase family)